MKSARVVVLAAGLVAGEFTFAHAASFSLTPITNTTPTFPGQISIMGTVTAGAGEMFYSPNVMSTVAVPFLPGFTAGYNALPQGWDPGFLAWGGTGTYTGPIYFFTNSPANLGYSGGMPTGLYGTNPLGPGGLPGLVLHYHGTDGRDYALSQNYAINVIPGSGGVTFLALGGLLAARRRR